MRKLSKRFALLALGAAVSAGLPAATSFAKDGETVQRTDVVRGDMPKPVRHAADDQTRGATDVKYQRQNRDGKTFYGVHYTKDGKRMEVRLDEAGEIVDGPYAARDQSGAQAGAGNEQAGKGRGDGNAVKYHGIANRDVQREVPKDVLKTMDPYTKDATDLFYQRQLRDGQTFYSVHYVKDGKRMFVRVDDKGTLALGPAESQSKEAVAAKPDAAQNATAEVTREAITVDQLPAEVRRTVESATGGGTDHSFVKQTQGSEVAYVVEYSKGDTRTSALIAPDGKIIEGETLAGIAAAPAPQASPAAEPVAEATPQGLPQPQADTDAQLAAARDAAAAAPYEALAGADQLPAEVRAALEKELAGANDALFQRFTRDGQTLYSAHYTNDKGRRSFTVVDSTGKTVLEPRKSNWQDGGKDVRFQAIGADQLPAQVRAAIEQEGGSNPLYVLRTDAKGKETFLAQYDARDGQRMEVEVNADGKMSGKAKRAKDFPDTILDRKKN